MAQDKDWKDKLAMLYGADSGAHSENDSDTAAETDEVQETNNPASQDLRVWIDRKGRKGKTATLVKGFSGSEEAMKALANTLKAKCGVGGSAKDGEIVIQGNQQGKVVQLLVEMGYKAKAAGA